MGVLTMEIEEKNKNISENQKKIERLTKKAEQEKEKKQYEKDLLIACQNDVKNSMDRVFQRCVENSTDEINLNLALYKFYDINIRNEYITTFGKTTLERDYIDKIYDKTLKQVHNKWAKHVENNKIQEFLRQEKEDNEIQKSTIYRILSILGITGFILFFILKWALIIGIVGCILVFIFISMCAKDK